MLTFVVYQRLVGIVKHYLSSSKVVVLIIPHRDDLKKNIPHNVLSLFPFSLLTIYFVFIYFSMVLTCECDNNGVVIPPTNEGEI